MLIKFNNEGKLVTITPHGDIPRQCGDLKIYVLFDEDYDLNGKQLWLRYKTPSRSIFEADQPMEKEELLWEFNKLPGENIGTLVDGKKYQMFSIDLTNTTANKESGNLEIVFTMYRIVVSFDDEGNEVSQLISTEMFGKTTIFIEETLGLAPYSGVGMTYSEYQTLINYINKIQYDLTNGRVGILKVSDYNSSTGEINIFYNDDIVDFLEYDDSTGELTIIW